MAGLLACTLFSIAPAGVEAAAADLSLRDVWTDTGLYFTAPLRWNTEDWMFFGGAVAAIAAAHEADGRIRNHFAGASPVLDGKDTNSIRDAIPGLAAVVGTWAFAQLGDSSDGRLEAYTMLEAAGLSSITSYGLKFAAGRRRPDETLHVDDWRAGGNSFPSLHACAAFSIGTVLAESGSDDLRWVRRLLGYGIATGTAYLRLKGNAHWFSDTVAGGAIGIATAEFTMNRREARKRSWQATVTPAAGGGVLIGFNITLP